MALAIGSRSEAVQAGGYCQLKVGGILMMSDTQMEQRTNREVVHKARGRVLISGLGIGMILVPILAKPEVTSVTVLELSQDVIDLVLPHVADPRLEVIQADVFGYKPPKGAKYDVIYHDIWPELSTDTLKEMTKLHRKYAHCLAPGGWQDSWRKSDLQRAKAKEKEKEKVDYRWGWCG
jgi:spermidine synthase